ncbi:hypothetical protein D3C84_1176360 [compost metagenome]
MGGRPSTVQQTGLGQDKGAGADRCRAASSLDAGAQVIQHPLGRLLEDGIAADHDHRIEHPLIELLGADTQATGGA